MNRFLMCRTQNYKIVQIMTGVGIIFGSTDSRMSNCQCICSANELDYVTLSSFSWGTISVGAGLLSSEAVARCRITFYHMLQIFGSVMSSLAVVFASCNSVDYKQTPFSFAEQFNNVPMIDVAVLGCKFAPSNYLSRMDQGRYNNHYQLN